LDSVFFFLNMQTDGWLRSPEQS